MTLVREVVQDIFLTETACYADVVLPASAFPEKTGTFTNTDRRVQLGRQALDPPGDARQDLKILIDELPDEAYPWVLNTGRQLEHWHSGAMSRRCVVLDAIEPGPVASLHPDDLEILSVPPGGELNLRSRRGAVAAQAREDAGLRQGQVFLPFCYQEAAANLLTNEALDPDGKIPEFKFCAIRVSPAMRSKSRDTLGFVAPVLDHGATGQTQSMGKRELWTK